MKIQFRRQFLILSLLAILIAGCASASPTGTPTPAASPSPTDSPTPEPTATATLVPTPTNTPLPDSEGPTLLLQTDFHTYQIIDFNLGITYPFTPPEPGIEYILASNVSPDRKRMIFTNNSQDIRIVELATGITRAIFNLASDDFDPESAIEAVREILPDLSYTQEMLENAVKTAFLESLQEVSWFRDSDHLLSVLSGSDASTWLTLVDLQSGDTIPLENESGFVQSVYPGPNENFILLKKSLIFDANVWEDDRYYLIDLTTEEVLPIPLPEDADNPSLGWFDEDHIRIIHKTDIDGSKNFSLLDIHTMESELVVTDLFSNVWKLGDVIAVFTRGGAEEESTFDLLSMQGEAITTQALPGDCTRSFIFGDQVLVNCEAESLLLDETLSPQSFGDPISLLRSSSVGIVIVTRSNEAFLYDPTLKNFQSLALAGEPLEILWLPDASGFLYRTYGTVYHYNLLTQRSQILLESDLFTDYRNLNAAWIILN